jgi:hypothetical protein
MSVIFIDEPTQNIHNFRTDSEYYSTFVLQSVPQAGGKMPSPQPKKGE